MDLSTLTTPPPPSTVGFLPLGSVVELGSGWWVSDGEAREYQPGLVVTLLDPLPVRVVSRHAVTADGHLVVEAAGPLAVRVRREDGTEWSAEVEPTVVGLVHYRPTSMALVVPRALGGWSTTTKVVLGMVGGVALAATVAWTVQRWLNRWAERRERRA